MLWNAIFSFLSPWLSYFQSALRISIIELVFYQSCYEQVLNQFQMLVSFCCCLRIQSYFWLEFSYQFTYLCSLIFLIFMQQIQWLYQLSSYFANTIRVTIATIATILLSIRIRWQFRYNIVWSFTIMSFYLGLNLCCLIKIIAS